MMTDAELLAALKRDALEATRESVVSGKWDASDCPVLSLYVQLETLETLKRIDETLLFIRAEMG